MNLENVQILAKWSTYWKMGHIDVQTWNNQKSGPSLCLAKASLKNMGMLMMEVYNSWTFTTYVRPKAIWTKVVFQRYFPAHPKVKPHPNYKVGARWSPKGTHLSKGAYFKVMTKQRLRHKVNVLPEVPCNCLLKNVTNTFQCCYA
jgi:hypothetical protein